MFEFANATHVNVRPVSHGCLLGEMHTVPAFVKDMVKPGAIAVWAPSPEAYLRMLHVEMPEPKQAKSSSRVSYDGDDFYKFPTYEKAMNVFLNNPHELRTYKESEEHLLIREQPGADVRFDLTGDFLDIGRYLSGEPEAFGQVIFGNPRGLFCTILVNLTAVHYVDQRAINRRSERILRLVDWLESQQIRCRIIATHPNDCIYFEVIVKDFHDVSSLDSLAIVTCSDFLRRGLFRAIEYSKTFMVHYGRPPKFKSTKVSEFSEFAGHSLFILTEYIEQLKDVDKAFDAVEEQLIEVLQNGDINFAVNL